MQLFPIDLRTERERTRVVLTAVREEAKGGKKLWLEIKALANLLWLSTFLSDPRRSSSIVSFICT
jgi:hypothetical protein